MARELRFRVRQPGRRVREVTLVTMLLDRRRYPARSLAELYQRRWQAEIDQAGCRSSSRLHLGVAAGSRASVFSTCARKPKCPARGGPTVRRETGEES